MERTKIMTALKNAKSPEEMMDVAKICGVYMTQESVQVYYSYFNADINELSGKEVGYGDVSGKDLKFVRDKEPCTDWVCPKCHGSVSAKEAASGVYHHHCPEAFAANEISCSCRTCKNIAYDHFDGLNDWWTCKHCR